MAESNHAGGRTGSGGVFERLERAVFFLVSTLTLRTLGILSAVVAAAAVVAVLVFSLPKFAPKPPPEVPAPALPAKPTASLAEVLRGDEPAATTATPQRPTPVPGPAVAANPDAPRTALDVELEPFRALARQLKLPFQSETTMVCARMYYWSSSCEEWEERVIRRGMLDLLKLDVFLDGEKDEVQIALLREARKLFGAIEGSGGAPADVMALSGPEGLKAFYASFLQPALEMTQGYRKIQRVTGRDTPLDQRLRLVEDLYPTVQALVAQLPDGKPEDRRALVGKTLAYLVKKETARSKEAATTLRAYAEAVDARDRKVAADLREHEEKVAEAAARRRLSFYVVLSSIGGLTALGILLALLAIERHLRALRGAWAGGVQGGATAPAAAPPRPEGVGLEVA